jgi:Mg2+ and Co2+ transporter CorA
MSEFKHSDREYSIERAIRKKILDRLGTCIALENNFQRRLSFMNQNFNTAINDNQNLPPTW